MRYIVNENIDPFLPGDVSWYANAEELLRHFEPWFADEPHLVIDADMNTYKLASGEAATMVLRPFGLSICSERLMALIEAANLPTDARSDFLDADR